MSREHAPCSVSTQHFQTMLGSPCGLPSISFLLNQERFLEDSLRPSCFRLKEAWGAYSTVLCCHLLHFGLFSSCFWLTLSVPVCFSLPSHLPELGHWMVSVAEPFWTQKIFESPFPFMKSQGLPIKPTGHRSLFPHPKRSSIVGRSEF